MSSNDLSERLQRAIVEGDRDTVRSLLELGADIHGVSSYRALPLTLASRYNRPEVIETLLAAGAQINRADSNGYTALMEAANCMANDSLRLLIQRGAEVNAETEKGITPLMYGVFALGENFATPAPDDVVAILLASGADLQAREDADKSALDIARETENDELVEFLLKSGAH